MAANAAAAAFRDFTLELIAERRRSPRDDLVSGLVGARVDGGHLSDAEIVSTVIVLLNAGHEAAVNTLGNGVRALMERRDEWEPLVDGSVSAAAAIEELLRYDPPLQLFERWVLDDGVEVAGVAIPRGEKIAVLFGAANRDPRVFASPDTFDVQPAERGGTHQLRRGHPRLHRCATRADRAGGEPARARGPVPGSRARRRARRTLLS